MAVDANKELERMSKSKQPEPKETKSKEEPEGKIDKTKFKRNSEAENEERFCFKYGEPDWQPEHSKSCTAK